jgi:hypothetical protein
MSLRHCFLYSQGLYDLSSDGAVPEVSKLHGGSQRYRNRTSERSHKGRQTERGRFWEEGVYCLSRRVWISGCVKDPGIWSALCGLFLINKPWILQCFWGTNSLEASWLMQITYRQIWIIFFLFLLLCWSSKYTIITKTLKYTVGSVYCFWITNIPEVIFTSHGVACYCTNGHLRSLFLNCVLHLS